MTLESPASFLFRSSQIWCRLFSNFYGYRRFFISISLSSLFYLLSEFPILYTYLITLFSCSNTSYSLLLSSTAFHKVMPTYMWSGAEETVWQIWVDFWLGLVILGNLQFRLDSFCFFIYERREQIIYSLRSYPVVHFLMTTFLLFEPLILHISLDLQQDNCGIINTL